MFVIGVISHLMFRVAFFYWRVEFSVRAHVGHAPLDLLLGDARKLLGGGAVGSPSVFGRSPLVGFPKPLFAGVCVAFFFALLCLGQMALYVLSPSCFLALVPWPFFSFPPSTIMC